MSTVMKKIEELRLVPIDLIDIAVQCRPINNAHVDRLAESITEIGLEQPVTVYQRGDRFILGPGAHRLAACSKLGHKDINAIVREDIGDDQIKQAQMIENLQRENMTPIEEAQACEQLLETLGGNIEQVAVMTGHPRRWVEQRLSFNRLSPRVHQLVTDGSLPLEYAYLIARVSSHEKQEEIAGVVAARRETRGYPYGDGRPEPFWRVRNLVEQAMRTLKGVSWKLDVPFADKPACDTCPNNSVNQPTLFADDKKIEPECLNSECYAEKSRLAGSSVRKAVNYMSKEDLDASTKNAETAIAAREVPFVDPKAVVSSAKTTKDPGKKTEAESRGRSKSDDDYKLQSELQDRVNAWENKLDEQIAAKLRGNQLAIGIFLLIRLTQDYNDITGYWFNPKNKKNAAALAKVLKLLDNLKSPSADGLSKVAKEIKQGDSTWRQEMWPINHDIDSNDDLPDAVRERLCEIYKIEMPAKPTMEEVKADLQKAAAAAAPGAEEQPAETPLKGKQGKTTKKKKKKSGKK